MKYIWEIKILYTKMMMRPVWWQCIWLFREEMYRRIQIIPGRKSTIIRYTTMMLWEWNVIRLRLFCRSGMKMVHSRERSVMERLRQMPQCRSGDRHPAKIHRRITKSSWKKTKEPGVDRERSIWINIWAKECVSEINWPMIWWRKSRRCFHSEHSLYICMWRTIQMERVTVLQIMDYIRR